MDNIKNEKELITEEMKDNELEEISGGWTCEQAYKIVCDLFECKPYCLSALNAGLEKCCRFCKHGELTTSCGKEHIICRNNRNITSYYDPNTGKQISPHL